MRPWALEAIAAAALLTVSVFARPQETLRYDEEYPFLKYRETEPTERVASLKAKLGRNEVRLQTGERGYLDSVLRALDLDPSSQMLVFSKTSLQTGFIRSNTPRAIYFNDDTYLAFVPDAGNLEIASIDPVLGPVFFTVNQKATVPGFERESTRCLSCHDSMSLSGGGVPRFIIGSGYTKPSGELLTHEGWIVTTARTPIRSRWGGWFVTGKPAATAHLGNMPVATAEALKDLDRARKGTLASLDGLVETRRYPAPTSDIVALLIFDHQVSVQNAIIRANYEARGAAPTPERFNAIAEPLVEALFSVDEPLLPGPIAGTSGFAEKFAARGLRDLQGRSLRDLDLQRRVFKYPLSYLIYSAAFQALPERLRRAVELRIDAIVSGMDTSGRFSKVSPEDRSAIRDILKQTR